jgi:hypothetical protein
MILRDYQTRCLDSIREGWKLWRKQLIVAATGSGKTVLFAQAAKEEVDRGGKVLILAHTEELIDQAIEKIQRTTLIMCGKEKADSEAFTTDEIVVASVQTLSREIRLLGWPKDHFRLVIVDECFPAGTLVDGRPIESIGQGDLVVSWNHQRSCRELRRVMNIFKRRPASMVRILFEGGRTLICTANHPIYTKRGYLPAMTLTSHDVVLASAHGYLSTGLQGLRHKISRILRSANLLKRLRSKSPNEESESSTAFDLPGLRQAGSTERQENADSMGQNGTRLLLCQVPGEISSEDKLENDGGDQPQIRFGSDEAQQPDGEGRNSPKDDSQVFRPYFPKSRGKWSDDQATEGIGRSNQADRVYGISDLYLWSRRAFRLVAAFVQGRYSRSNREAGDRSRWEDTPDPQMALSRPQKDRGLTELRVDRVEVLEPAGRSGFARVCPDGFVYNLEIEGNSNYFADGILAHNCHHSLAASYTRILAHFEGARVLGVTATADRGDKRNLAEVFENIPFQFNMIDAVKDGWLVRPIVKTVPVEIDMKGVKSTRTSLGYDYDPVEVTHRLEPLIAAMCAALVREIGRRRTVVYVPSIHLAKMAAEAISRHGIRCQFVSGECPDRDEKMQALRDGRVQVTINAYLLVEGFDDPQISCISVWRLTKIRSLLEQCLDEETEILTLEGWKRDVAVGELVAAFDPKTQEIQYVPALEVIRRPMAGEAWASIKTQSCDIRVTAGHQMLYDRRQKQRGWKFKSAADLAAYRYGSYLPAAGFSGSAGVELTDDEIRFIGWFMTDGSMNKEGKGICIDQGQHQPYCEDIERMLVGCGFKFGKRVWWGNSQFKRSSPNVRWTISFGKPRGRDKHLRGWGALEHWVSKDFAPALMSLSAHQFDVLIEAIHKGDGAKQRGQSWTQRSYHIITGNRTFADRLQTTAIRSGYRANISPILRENATYWTVHLKKCLFHRIGGTSADRPNWQILPSRPNESCWCVRNDLGTLVTRRNGKAIIVGNCVGRGLRPLTEIVPALNAAGSAEERRLLLAGSLKPDMLILDFLWLTEKLDLVRPADLVITNAEIAQHSKTMDQQGDLLDLAEFAARDYLKALEKRMAEVKNRKARVIDPLSFAVSIHDEELEMYEPSSRWEINKPSEGQARLLTQLGIDATKVTNSGFASHLIDKLLKRRKLGLASVQQMNFLGRLGLHEDRALTSYKEAKAKIDERLAELRARSPQAKKKVPQLEFVDLSDGEQPVENCVEL